MEWVSFVEILVAALAAIPGLQTALLENRKRQVAQELLELTEILGRILHRGNQITDIVGSLNLNETGWTFDTKKQRLMTLVEEQLQDIYRIHSAMHFMSESKVSRLLSTNGFRVQGNQSAAVQRILSIYEPNLVHALDGILIGKSNVLYAVLERWKAELDTVSYNNLRITDTSWTGATNTYNLRNDQERNAYIASARSRLSRLEESLSLLRQVIRERFDVIDLI